MSESPVPAPAMGAQRGRRRIRRLLLVVAMLIALPVAGLLGLYFYNHHLAENALDEAIAEADRLDPGWRLADIEKRRTAVPLEMNAAVPILEAANLVSGIVLGLTDDERDALREEPPQFQLDPAIAAKLRKSMDKLLQAEALARVAVPLKKGWYPYQWTPNIISTAIPNAEHLRHTGEYLNYLAMLLSQDGKHDEAWLTSLTILALPRSIGEDPFLLSMFVRVGLRTRAVSSFERCLAHGTVSDALLADAQRQIAEEAKQPIVLYGLRGDRAWIHAMLTNLEAGRINLADIVGKESVALEWQYRVTASSPKKDHAWLLRYYNEAVESTKLHPAQMLANMQALDAKVKVGPPLTRYLGSSLARVAERGLRTHVVLACDVAGIGVERFRLRHGRWPDSLDEVVAAGLLDKVPTDLFDGKPLRYRKTTDGVVVYSVSQMGNYAGDALDQGKTFDSNFTRVEFRLWDEKARGQPARPKPKLDDEKGGGNQAMEALEVAIAETGQLDPEWRFVHIEKRRKAISAEQNAAIPIMAAAALIPDSWLDFGTVNKQLLMDILALKISQIRKVARAAKKAKSVDEIRRLIP
jgi:hypothetical protein